MTIASPPKPLTLMTATVAILMIIPAVSAQAPNPPPMRETIILKVKPDMVDEFIALQKEANVRLKKLGMPWRRFIRAAAGDTYEFRISSPVPKWAALDQPGWIGRAFDDPSELANWVGRIQKCLLSREVFYSVNYPELSIPLKEGRNPGFLVITVLENAPTKGPAFAEYLKNELIPAYKKAGVDGVGVSRRRFGTNSRHWLIITFLDKMEELDEPHPLAKSLGEENWSRIGGSVSRARAGREFPATLSALDVCSFRRIREERRQSA